VAEIWELIAQDNPATATRFILELTKQLETLNTFPARCPRISEEVALDAEYRHLIYGNYRTIFSIHETTVRVARIIHRARLLPVVKRSL